MGAMIFSCTPGARIMSPYSKIMFHEPLIFRKEASPLSQIEADVKDLSEKRDILADLLCERTGKQRKDILKILGKDKYFSVSEAKETCLCDKEGTILNLGEYYG